MSFILDALKKSEIERQRQSVPGLMDTGPALRRARFPVWAIALAALLAVNLAVLIIVLARGGLPSLSGRHSEELRAAAPHAAASHGSAPDAAVDSVPAASSAAAPAPRPNLNEASPAPAAAPPAAPETTPTEHHFSPMDAAQPVYAPEIPADTQPAAPGASGQSNRAAPPAASASRARERDPLLTTGDDKSDQEVLPSISELNLTGADALPDLHIDVHVYATKPAERFVYINMRKYREGNTLAEGPVLERIRRDGVVLDYHGLRFVLPRQQ
jgi:general secretion pathway protein B